MRSRRVLFLSAIATIAGLSPSAGRAQTAFERSQAFQKTLTENNTSEFLELDPDHPSRPISDVMAITGHNGQLILRTNLPATPEGQQRKLKVGADQDWSLVIISDGATGAGPVIPTSFNFNQTRFEPDQTIMLSVQQMGNLSLNINEQIQSETGRKVVQALSLYPNPQSPGLFRVLVSDQLPGKPGGPVMWSSANFASFMREHPVVADHYLRPLLHHLSQDSALAPDPMLTFEAFADARQPDAVMTRKVHALIPQLDGGTFHTRIHAERNLADLGKDAAVILMHLDRTKLDAEQNARIDKLLTPYLPIAPAQLTALRADPAFLQNCLYSEDPLIRTLALADLEKVAKMHFDFDPTADVSARERAIPNILAQLAASGLVPVN